jgi:uncharacterized protein
MMKKFSINKIPKISVYLISFLLAIASEVNSQNQIPTGSSGLSPVTVPGTETRDFHSNILNRDMVLFIKFPVSYHSNPQKVYPCWYFTDANLSFPLVASIAGIFDFPEITGPEIFIVGIGYKIQNMGEWGAFRSKDLTPTNIPSADDFWSGFFSKVSGKQIDVKTGGAAKFLDFFVTELFSFIESNYRVSPTGRGLGGYSYGGLFSLYVLFSQPELFNIYYAGSPSIKYDNGLLFTLEDKYAQSYKDLKAKLFMSAGGSEDTIMVSNVKKMAAQLESRNYPGLTMNTHVFPDETHNTCIPSSVMRAFSVLYKH